ncbi:DUF1376 domain-containing protein [Microvirga mediterraneensis]|uniref:DUF1376 domain-containing protein n=1 Tax=Microvirga mediterraneensis TaxID=2754695 RepID=A0A838BPQ4_9HYPH|nr:DUF1376 domain-containing protein [Microvirga mediterraneensis]MBA1156913.1 DUF1376 domain-containing protein [Microvirga mediterraneensis]
MSQYPSLPLFTDAYIADTAHLTNEEHGAYLRLLMFAWRSPDCALPDDDVKLARMLGLTAKKWASLKVAVMAFWRLEDGRWTTERWHMDVGVHPCRWDRGNWQAIREVILQRDGPVCRYCGDIEGPFDIDHIHPRARGGKNEPSNLTVACCSCNRSKGSRLISEWRQ